jgi:hypothetical protein
VNINKVKQLRNYIAEQADDCVDMGDWMWGIKNIADLLERRKSECGTVGCIAGHACMIMAERFIKPNLIPELGRPTIDFMGSAADWLEMKSGFTLFDGSGWSGEESMRGKQAALARLDFIIEHGYWNLGEYSDWVAKK